MAAYMRLDGVPGLSRLQGLIGWIEISSYSSRTSSLAGSARRNVTLEEMLFTTPESITLTGLMKAVSTGGRIESGEFVVGAYAAGVWRPTFRIDFEDAHIASMQVLTMASGRPGASFSLVATKHGISFGA